MQDPDWLVVFDKVAVIQDILSPLSQSSLFSKPQNDSNTLSTNEFQLFIHDN